MWIRIDDIGLVRKLASCNHELRVWDDEDYLRYNYTHEPHEEVRLVIDAAWTLAVTRSEFIMRVVNWIREVHEYQEKLNDTKGE